MYMSTDFVEMFVGVCVSVENGSHTFVFSVGIGCSVVLFFVSYNQVRRCCLAGVICRTWLVLRCISIFRFDMLDGGGICAYTVLTRDVLVVLEDNVG